MDLLGATIEGRYRVDARLGRGAMGEVFVARQLNLEREVAIKVIHGEALADPHAVERFKREALAVARLRHPNIVVVFDFGVSAEAGAYLVMERLRGQSMRDEIAARRRIPAAEAVALMQPVCLAVHAAHEAGVLHRDLKPANLFVESSAAGRIVKILDFGLAKLADAADPSPRGDAGAGEPALTVDGTIVGTPLYMAPEQCLDVECDARADVYALGCVLYEMVTGRTPISGASVEQILMSKITHEPAPARIVAPDVPEALDAALGRALARERDARFATAAELADAIAAAVGAASPAPEAAVSAPVSPVRASNLPRPVTTFIGNARRPARIAAQLRASRLVTLAGPGGIGKTRLALEVAETYADEYPDGVWLVDLTAARDPSLVPSAVAHALGVPEELDRPIADLLTAAIARKQCLILLDNCEHLVAASGELVGRLLRDCEHLHVLVTSRELLGIAGESVQRVEPLASSDAVRLFVDRARLGKPDFALTERNSEAIEAICQRLDGIPLAIELAAARARVLSVDQILARMDDRFRLLSFEDGRSSLGRQRRLRATIDWSYDLLTDDERSLFARLSVFAGAFSLEAVEAVCAGDGIDELAVLDLTTRLADKSLVMVEETGDAVRFRLLETIRQYASERLVESGEPGRWRRAHRDWYLERAERLGARQPDWQEGQYLKAIDAERDNFRAALQWSIREARDASESLRLAAALSAFWELRTLFAEGRAWLEEALALEGDSTPQERARVCSCLQAIALAQGDFGFCLTMSERVVALRREAGDPEVLMATLGDHAGILYIVGEHVRSLEVLEEALGLAIEAGDAQRITRFRYLQGMLAMWRGDLDDAATHFHYCLESYRQMNSPWRAATILNNLGEVERLQGDLSTAAEHLDECLRLAREADTPRLVADTLNGLARVECDRGNLDAARALLAEAVAMQREMRNKGGLVDALESFAWLAAESGEPARALEAAEAAARARTEIRAVCPEVVEAEMRRRVRPPRPGLSDEEARRAIERGRSMTLDQAVEDVFGPAGGVR